MEYIKSYLQIQIAYFNEEIQLLSSKQVPTNEEKISGFDLVIKKTEYENFLVNGEVKDIPKELREESFNYLKKKYLDSIKKAQLKVDEILANVLGFKLRLDEILFDNFDGLNTVVTDKDLYLESLGKELLHPNAIFSMGIQSKQPSPAISQSSTKRKVTVSTQENEPKRATKARKDVDVQALKVPDIAIKVLKNDEDIWYVVNQEYDQDISNASFVSITDSIIGPLKFSNTKGTILPKSTGYIQKPDGSLLSVGAGLAATKNVNKGDALFTFEGKVQTYTEYKQEIKSGKTKPYYAHYYGKVVTGHSKGQIQILNCYDQCIEQKCFASMVNSATHLVTEGFKKITPNCKIIRSKGKVYIRAIADIKAGEEFFCLYGKSFSYAKAQSNLQRATNLGGDLSNCSPSDAEEEKHEESEIRKTNDCTITNSTFE
jgi:hypothetical protein